MPHLHLPLSHYRVWSILLWLGWAPLYAQVAKWEVQFQSSRGQADLPSIAVPLSDGSGLVAIMLPGAVSQKPVAYRAGLPVEVELIGNDPVSRLCLLKSPELAERISWGSAEHCSPGTALTMPGKVRARSGGWVKQIGTKVLPFALLRISFEGDPPPTGTPLSTSDGRVVALVYQPSEAPGTAYAIPTDAALRVLPDILKQGRMIRGWIGVSMRAESSSPLIQRLTPGSPAEKAGVRPNDQLTRVGGRPISHYADAANAFFYLIPGQPVDLVLMRGADEVVVNVVPISEPLDR